MKVQQSQLKGVLPIMTVLAFVPLIIAILIFGVQQEEERYEWDEMKVVPFENTTEGEYVKIVGRINETDDFQLKRDEDSNGKKNVLFSNFNLSYLNESIVVNISNYDFIIPPDGNDNFLNGDLIFVVGTIYFENGTRSIHAKNIVYDHSIYASTFEEYYASLIAIIGALCLVSGWIASHRPEALKSRWRSRNPKIKDFQYTPHKSDEKPDLPRNWGLLIVKGILYVCGPLYFIFLVAEFYLFFAVLNIIDFDVHETHLYFLLLFSVINASTFTPIFVFHTEYLENVAASQNGIYFQYLFRDVSFYKWEEIENIGEDPFALLLKPINEKSIRLDVFSKKRRSEIITIFNDYENLNN